MNKRNNRKAATNVAPKRPTQPIATKSSKPKATMKPRTARWLTYAVGFVALLVFVTWGYGDIFTRAEQNSYITTSSESMYYLLSQPMGHLYWLARWALLLFKWTWLGGIILALIYTLTARLTDYAMQLPRRWEGIGFLVPVAELIWIMVRGTNVYYQTEPSMFVIVTISVLLITALLALVTKLITLKRESKAVPQSVRPLGGLLALVAIVGTLIGGRIANQNVILTARLKNLEMKQDWETMMDDVRQAKRPTRAVAAYYAIALEETDQILQGTYDIPYDFPKLHLDSINGTDEYGIFTADCSFHAGFLNTAYRCALEHTVMNGPRLDCYKLLAKCALLMGEKELCRKYLALVAQMPFEGDFVEKYTAMLNNPKLIDEDAELKHVLSLGIKEDGFEQNYRPPFFLGYNMGLNQGSDNLLITSAAACLYSKDLQAFLIRAQIMAQKGMTFTPPMQQAIAILSLKMPGLLQQFPQVGQFVMSEISAFINEARPYAKDRLKLREEMKKNWLGTYVYYYYCENNDPELLMKTDNTKEQKNQVN